MKKKLSGIPIDYSWSFSEKTIKDTSYITHGYYTYLAKFIPQLASRLINEYTNVGDIVIDSFAGSLTTLKAAKDLGYKSIGCELSETYIREGLARIGVHGFSTPSNKSVNPTKGILVASII